MKVALLISGYLRSYSTNIDTLLNNVINKFNNIDIYLHITKNENNEDKYLNKIDEKDIESIIKKLNPISTIIEENIHYSDDRNINSVINHWCKLYKLNQIKKINESLINSKYDLVIRYRPDLSIISDNIFDFWEKDSINIPKDSKIDKSKLINKIDNYLCDGFSFGTSEMMDRYFNIYTELPKMISDYGAVSETILYNYLNNNKINYKLLDIDYNFILSKCNVFAICGDSGSGKSTLSSLLKGIFDNSFTLECDRYHKWERTDKNWESVTHLNPDANYITKMNEDVFNLKIGNHIYQVDYDHHSGKFTEKQRVNPSDNLIVCGLHSLYNDKDSIYNLKIFMDTDDNLKRKWKINRDVKERGYSVEKVLESIRRRENDFKKFIYPQKNNSDLVIKFYTEDNIDFNELQQEYQIHLKLSVNKKLNSETILKNLNNQGVKFEIINDDDNFVSFIFKTYQNINLGFNTNSFYDYILYVILNL